jgi:hypothetical protein
VTGSPPYGIVSPVVVIEPAENSLYTVTVTSSVAVHPFAVFVAVTVYVVVEEGFAVGFAAVASLSPVVGLHEYVTPLTAVAPIVVLVPSQIEMSLPASAAGAVVFSVTVILSVSVHPFAAVVAVTV